MFPSTQSSLFIKNNVGLKHHPGPCHIRDVSMLIATWFNLNCSFRHAAGYPPVFWQLAGSSGNAEHQSTHCRASRMVWSRWRSTKQNSGASLEAASRMVGDLLIGQAGRLTKLMPCPATGRKAPVKDENQGESSIGCRLFESALCPPVF